MWSVLTNNMGEVVIMIMNTQGCVCHSDSYTGIQLWTDRLSQNEKPCTHSYTPTDTNCPEYKGWFLKYFDFTWQIEDPYTDTIRPMNWHADRQPMHWHIHTGIQKTHVLTHRQTEDPCTDAQTDRRPMYWHTDRRPMYWHAHFQTDGRPMYWHTHTINESHRQETPAWTHTLTDRRPTHWHTQTHSYTITQT